MKYFSRLWVIIIIISASLLNVSLWYFFSPQQVFKEGGDMAKISKITGFLDQISPDFTKDLEAWVEKNKSPSWGCGPTSYALGKIINKKFFNNELIIDAFYDQNPYEIVQRFGFIKYKRDGEEITGDHAWIEVYLHDKMIMIDPTADQYQKGNIKGIAYEVFDLGDPDIHNKLKDKYGILEARLSILMRKVLNKIPVDEIPYPGLTIDPQDIPYFQQVFALRNTVSLGREPISWKPWVDYFTSKYN